MTALTIAQRPSWRPLTDVAAMTAREIRRTLRSIDMLTTSFLIPVAVMLVFDVVFGGAIQKNGEYINYVVPATLILCSGFGSAVTAVSVSKDMKEGIIDRFRTMPIFGASVLVGHVMASIVRNLASSAVVIGVALLLGFRPTADLGHWIIAIAYLALAISAFTWISCAAGLVLSEEAAGGVNFVFLFLPYVSSGFVAADTMPGWLQGFAHHQPFTPIIETLRALLNGTSLTAYAWPALAWLLGLLIVGYAASLVLFRKRVAR